MSSKKRAIPMREYLMLNTNPVVRFLTVSDTIFIGATGLLGPVFALFIVDFIEGGNAAVAGIAAAIYLVAKSLVQIPAASIGGYLATTIGYLMRSSTQSSSSVSWA